MSKVIKPEDHKANQANDNKGTSGTNKQRQKVLDNRSQQLDSENPKFKPKKDKEQK